jgi:predicted CXXCH cytochrome family protein
MRVKFLPLIAVMAAAVLALTMVSGGRAAVGDIFSSAHDLGSPGNPTCAQCHIPHQAQGDYLWAMTPGATTLGGDTGPLCFSCHDGTIAGKEYIFAVGTVNHPMGADTHLYNEHDPSRGCVACHDPHDADFKFTWDVMRTGNPENPDNANVCLSCHTITNPTHGLGSSHPFDVEDPADLSWRTAEEPDVPTNVVQMTTVLPVDQTFSPEISDTTGTRLWDSATRQTAVAAGQPGKLGCLTCHSPHGAVLNPDIDGTPQPETLNTMAPYSTTDSTAPICQNCHR